MWRPGSAFICVIVMVASLQRCGASANINGVLQGYWTQTQLESWMDDFIARCNHVARKHALGESARGQTVWALEITGDIQSDAPVPKANFRYVGNVHGDEPLGRQLLPALAEFICGGADDDDDLDLRDDVAALLGGIRLFLVPTMNPDGFKRTGVWTRENANRVDLNRNFPDWIREGLGPSRGRGGNEALAITNIQQPETVAMMRWAHETRFVGSCVLHEGAMVANYPWDGRLDMGMQSKYHASPDDATFRMLAARYAALHSRMQESSEFRATRGITNGSAWYPVYGGMQDWMYLAGDAFELTLEISESKHPPVERIAKIWSENKAAMVKYPVALAYGGLYGQVTELVDGVVRPLADTVVQVEGVDKATVTGPLGEFFRPLASGTYTVRFLTPRHSVRVETVVLSEDVSTPLSVRLQPCTPAAQCDGPAAVADVVARFGWLSPVSLKRVAEAVPGDTPKSRPILAPPSGAAVPLNAGKDNPSPVESTFVQALSSVGYILSLVVAGIVVARGADFRHDIPSDV